MQVKTALHRCCRTFRYRLSFHGLICGRFLDSNPGGSAANSARDVSVYRSIAAGGCDSCLQSFIPHSFLADIQGQGTLSTFWDVTHLRSFRYYVRQASQKHAGHHFFFQHTEFCVFLETGCDEVFAADNSGMAHLTRLPALAHNYL